MSYHQYTTEGIILESVARGEADRRYSIFTEDLGLILARGRSVRKEKSKLNSSLQTLSFSTVSVIRGKNEWKITTAISLVNLFFVLRKDREKLETMARVCDLILKFVVGEEKNLELFSVIKNSVNFLMKNDFTKDEMFSFECIFVLRVLNALGYVSRDDFEKSYFSNGWSFEMIKSGILNRAKIVRAINKSLKSSHLS